MWRRIVRRRVVKTAAQLLRLVLAYCLSGFSLRTTAAWAEAAGQASFSDVALLQRLRRCGPWLAALVSQLSGALHPEAVCGACARRRAIGGIQRARKRWPRRGL